ncbi:MAG: ribosome small subunit-dependent GTPase A [Methanomicrobiaceae archaeon]|nr:ribosome small subunit-dependent GTPase A [Methanomicrobiaceae archaeon]
MNETTTTPHMAGPLTLQALGWDEACDAAFARYSGPYSAGRVSSRHRTVFDVLLAGGSVRTGISGALRRLGRAPAVGDFVVIPDRPDDGTRMIVDILPRRTTFSRGAPGEGGDEQVIAANIDTVFIVTAAGADFNLRRLERYLAVVYVSGARPVIVINKADLAEDPGDLVMRASAVAGNVPVVAVSALREGGLSGLDEFLQPGRTIALIGSSGVGKSTIINALMAGAVQETGHVREWDGKGRHTTSVRQLCVLPGGAMLIDNPGLREIRLGTAGSGIREAFPDVLELARGCRYPDCRHESEPGCAVREAVCEGLLPEERLMSYLRLAQEVVFQTEKAKIGLKRLEKKRRKVISKAAREFRDDKRR